MPKTARHRKDATPAAGFKLASSLVWLIVDDEVERTYHFPGGNAITVPDPYRVNIKRDATYTGIGARDSHRVITRRSDGAFGRSYYIPVGWIGISWEPKPGKPAYAF